MQSGAFLVLQRQKLLNNWSTYVNNLGKPSTVGLCQSVSGSAEWQALELALASFDSGEPVVIDSTDQITSVPRNFSAPNASHSDFFNELSKDIIILWRGGDLSTRSEQNHTGSSLQIRELSLLEIADCDFVSGVINRQLMPKIAKFLGYSSIDCTFKIKCTVRSDTETDLSIDDFLYRSGYAQSKSDLYVRYNRSLPVDDNDVFKKEIVKNVSSK